MIAPARPKKPAVKPRCGLCGKRGKLTKTDCCGNWICDDTPKYVLFSYAHNSCYRNHDRYTLCAAHHHEGHSGSWKDCQICRKSYQTEMYVWYCTNEYNFEKLENPPAYEPTKCAGCGVVIKLSEGGYSQLGDRCLCLKCSDKEIAERIRKAKKSK
jgi:hypothetical protein